MLLNLSISATEPDKSDQSIIAFDQNYFSQYQALTLTDLIRTVPGGVSILNRLRNNRQSRGLGSSGTQILIDGVRMSGKANDVSARLDRIQSTQVERIDLIRGTVEGMDVRNDGIMLNVILKKNVKSTNSYLTEFRVMHNSSQGAEPEMLIALNGSRDSIEYGLSYHNDVWTRAYDEIEDRMSANREIEENRELERAIIRDLHKITGNLGYRTSRGDNFRFNGYFHDSHRSDIGNENQFDAISSALLATEYKDIDFKDKKWEFGADYEGQLTDNSSLTALVIVSHTENNDTIIQEEVVNSLTEPLFNFHEDSTESEQILRVNYSYQFNSDNTLEIGGELALNELDAKQSFDFEPYEHSIISEDRYEVFGNYSTSLREGLKLQTSLTREQSTIEQDTIGFKDDRSFSYWKPRLELRYDYDERNQLRLVIDRMVSQLNLRHYIAKRNTEDDTIELGNPDLEPEKVLKYSLVYEHRFSEETGAIEVELFRDDITDYISKAPLGDDSSGTGNIGDATIKGINLELNNKLGVIGLDNALLSLKCQYRETATFDPFLQESRVLNSVPTDTFILDYRHDIPSLGLVYGIGAHKRTSMYRSDVTLYEIRSNSIHVSEAYIEYNWTDEIKLRFEVRNPLNDKKRYDKTFYVDNISEDIVDYVEYRRSDVRPTYAIKLQATF